MSATALSAVGNDRIAMGGNLPPDVIAFNTIDAYYDEAKNWASDGFKIDNQAQADEIDALDKALLKAQQDADELREAEKKPHDDASKAVQAKFNPYVQKDKGKTYLARASLKTLLTVWRNAQLAIAAAAAAKIEADRLAEVEALRAAREQADGSLAAAEQIEQLETSVKQATKAAEVAVKVATVGTGLRSYWDTKVTDPRALAGHYWKTRSDEVDAFFLSLAKSDVLSGARNIPGCEITEQKRA